MLTAQFPEENLPTIGGTQNRITSLPVAETNTNDVREKEVPRPGK